MSLLYEIPLASHSFGYILILVKPGMVLISLTKISRLSKKKIDSGHAFTG